MDGCLHCYNENIWNFSIVQDAYRCKLDTWKIGRTQGGVDPPTSTPPCPPLPLIKLKFTILTRSSTQKTKLRLNESKNNSLKIYFNIIKTHFTLPKTISLICVIVFQPHISFLYTKFIPTLPCTPPPLKRNFRGVEEGWKYFGVISTPPSEILCSTLIKQKCLSIILINSCLFFIVMERSKWKIKKLQIFYAFLWSPLFCLLGLQPIEVIEFISF